MWNSDQKIDLINYAHKLRPEKAKILTPKGAENFSRTVYTADPKLHHG